MPKLPFVVLTSVLICGSFACSTTIVGEEEEEKLSIAASGRWMIPADVLAIGDTQFVDYVGAGRWKGSSGCGGGPSAGATELGNFITQHFPQVSFVGGYACRPIVGNSSQMSVHATGRALDIHIPTVSGSANNVAGDAIGNWLIANAEDIGIQYVIWDRTQWTAERSAGTKARRYGGSHAHHDHLHVELSVAGGKRQTPWFSGTKEEPDIPACDTISRLGATIDNDSLCLQLNGDSRFWRNVDGSGHGTDLVWTNAFAASNPSNWAKWSLDFEEAGTYHIEVFLEEEFARFDRTRYQVNHAGQQTVLELDQGAASGWVSLGFVEFSAGGGQSLAVFDNTSGDPGTDRSIAVDAIRLTRQP